MRTDEQRQAFALECWEIEKAGGNVLEHIRVNWPSYTPGATWFNLQRVYLPKKPMTSGKPEVKGDGETVRRDRMTTLDGILKALKDGRHPYDYLESIGYLNTMQAYADVRSWARKNAPEKFEQLPASLRGLAVRPKSAPINFKDKPAPELKAGEALPVKLPEKTGEHVSAEEFRKTVEFKGKEYERMNKPSPTCCQPARPSGVTVPDELPGGPKPLEIVAVRCSVKRDAKYEKRNVSDQYGEYVSLVWHEPAGGEQCLTLEVKDWMKLAGEIPVMLQRLGLI